EVHLDVILGARFPRTLFWKRVARAGDDPPAGAGKADHGGMPDAAAGSGEQQGAARLIASRHRGSVSRIKARLGPATARRFAPELDAVVQTERTVVPELDPVRYDPISAPVRRPRDRSDHVFRGVARDRLLERQPALERCRLSARPG